MLIPAILRERVRTALWFLPALAVAAAVAVAVLTLAVDGATSTVGWLAFGGSASSAQSLLSSIVTSLMTLTALVFSITIVALQLASTQYSPRVLRSFLRDRFSQSVLAVFVGAFVYAILVLRAVRGGGGNVAFVPQISVHVALALTVVSLGFFVAYVHHVAQAIQASSIVAEVAKETAAAIRRLPPTCDVEADGHAATPVSSWPSALTSRSSGYVQDVDESRMVAVAAAAGVVVRLVHGPGDFVAAGTTLLRLSAVVEDDASAAFEAAVTLGRERSVHQDPGFGFRQLVDVVERAMSPGINDPTTAVQGLDRIFELLVLLAGRQIPGPERRDDHDVVRLVVPTATWGDYVRLAFDQVLLASERSIQLRRRLDDVLTELAEVVPAERLGPIETQRRRLAVGLARTSDGLP